MPEQNDLSILPDNLLQTLPGGMAKLALDDTLTILYATDKFLQMIRSVAERTVGNKPGALLRMVYSADVIYVTQQIAAHKNRKDSYISINFRTLQQDGSMKWIMITGNKTDEVHQSGARTFPVFSCMAVDISSIMVNYKMLEQKNDYHRVISELSKDLFFEYEIATDTLTFSELFREVFGHDPVLKGFRHRLDKTKIIHSDELPAVVAIYNSMMSGRKQVRFELRLLPRDGNYSWYTCYASIIFDENRNPYKVVGKLSIRSTVPKEMEIQAFEPVLDPISNVNTKDSAETMIKDALLKQKQDALSALLLIDIRNYKALNEIMKSINKDELLILIGKILHYKFRLSDIIGRIGVSEFVVYLKDLPSDKMVYEIADSLCDEISRIYPYKNTQNGIYASIGIAFTKGAQDYQTLFANANTALVMAKKVSTGAFEVFSGRM